MAVTLPAQGTGTTTPVVATDQIGGEEYQLIKLGIGAAGAFTLLTGGSGTVGAGTVRVTLATDVALPAGTNNIGDVDVLSSALPTGASTSAKQDTIIGHVDGIEALLTTIDADTGTLAGAVSGSEMQVDVVGALPAGTNAIGKLAANSGVDIGDVDVTSAVISTGGDTQSNRDVDTAAEQGPNVAAKFGVIVRADRTNTGIVYVGVDSSITAGTTDATDGVPLYAGDSITIPVANANQIYVIGSANNQIVYYGAF